MMCGPQCKIHIIMCGSPVQNTRNDVTPPVFNHTQGVCGPSELVPPAHFKRRQKVFVTRPRWCPPLSRKGDKGVCDPRWCPPISRKGDKGVCGPRWCPPLSRKGDKGVRGPRWSPPLSRKRRQRCLWPALVSPPRGTSSVLQSSVERMFRPLCVL